MKNLKNKQMTAEEFIPKSETGKYSRNQLVQWAERYHKYKLEELRIGDVRELAMLWWNELGGNPLLRMIKQGELTTKYYGQFRKISSLTGREIQNIYVSEHVT